MAALVSNFSNNHCANRRFAFIVHPSNYQHVKGLTASLKLITRIFPQSVIGGFLLHLPPIRYLSTAFAFGPSETADCIGIICPMLPVQMVTHQEQTIKKILEAIRVAQRLGANLVGLGGFTSIIGDGGLEIARKSPLPVTSGNTYTATVILQSISSAADLLELDLKTARIAIIGATGDIGSACAKELAKRCGCLVLVARNEERLRLLSDTLKKDCAAVEIAKKPGQAASNADVVVTVTSSITTLIEPHELKSGSIICDASYPANVSREVRSLRNDVLVFEGGIVCWPELWQQVAKDNPLWNFNPPVGVHGCFAETLLLALEKRFTTYSIGRGGITSEKIYEMARIADKYRVSPAKLWNGQGSYSSKEIEVIKRARLGQGATYPALS